MDWLLWLYVVLFLALVVLIGFCYFFVIPSQRAAVEESKLLRSDLADSRSENRKLQQELQATRKELAETRKGQEDLQDALAICNASHVPK